MDTRNKLLLELLRKRFVAFVSCEIGNQHPSLLRLLNPSMPSAPIQKFFIQFLERGFQRALRFEVFFMRPTKSSAKMENNAYGRTLFTISSCVRHLMVAASVLRFSLPMI